MNTLVRLLAVLSLVGCGAACAQEAGLVSLSTPRGAKQAFILKLDVPPPTLQGTYNIPEANELYRKAMTYKDQGWGTAYIDNQRRSELLLPFTRAAVPAVDLAARRIVADPPEGLTDG